MDMALSREQWAAEALAALARGGPGAVAVEPLAKRLGATKGSFYWHFSDRNQLLAAALELWERRDTDDVIARLETIQDPTQRLIALSDTAFAKANAVDVHAALLGALGDDQIAAAVRRVTDRRIAFTTQAFRQLGLTEAEARLEAHLVYATYIGVGQLSRILPGGGLNPSDVIGHAQRVLAGRQSHRG
jgi:AcrR family transcriptional regulator